MEVRLSNSRVADHAMNIAFAIIDAEKEAEEA